jgi:hypothetical protein
MTYIAFKLSMPRVNSWNGKWSGEEKLFAIVKSFRADSPLLKNITDKAYWTYHFGDGWVAGVRAHFIDAKESKSIKKRSAGFCGYDWMVDSIIQHGDIRC